jgi:MFS family permease
MKDDATHLASLDSRALAETVSLVEMSKDSNPPKDPDNIPTYNFEEHAIHIALEAVSDNPKVCGPPQDGGEAWLQVLMGHIIIFNTWGYINSYGAFQTYYVAHLGHPPSDISWVGSVQVFLLFFIGTFSGRAADAGYFRTVFSAGLLAQLLGVFMTSISSKYYQLFLAQGVLTGLGNGLLFCPSLSVLSTYHGKRKALAIGIAACGTGTGGLVFPAIAQQLLPKIGFGWTLRVMGFVMLGTMSLPLAFTRSRLPPRRTGPIVEWGAFQEPAFLFYAIGITLCFWGLYFAFYYVSTEETDYDLTHQLVAWLVADRLTDWRLWGE